MKWSFKLLTFTAAAMLFVSCKKTNTQGRYIPANAALAMHVNGKSISEKISWSDIKANPLFDNVYSDSTLSANVKKILDNPENSGIDTKTDMMVFLQKDSAGGYVAFEGTIKNEAAFKAFCSEVTDNAKTVEKDGISYAVKFPLCIGWDKEHFVYIADAPQVGKMDALSRRMMNDSIDISSDRKPRDITATCQGIFALDKSKSLAEDERFSKLVNESGDIHFWMNSEELYKNGETNMALAMLNLEKLYKGSVTAATLNFDNGQINMKARGYAGEELTKLYKKFGGGKVSEDMLKRMPGKDVMGVVALNFKPEGLREFLKLLNIDGFFNIGAASLGFTMDDFIKANKGDIMIGFSDFKIATDTSNYAFKDPSQMEEPVMPKPEFNFVFGASIGDKDAFNKLISSGKKLGGNFVQSGVPVDYSSNGNYFALSNSKENADKFIAGGAGNGEYISKIAGYPIAGYFNIQSILKAFGGEASKDSTAKVIYDASLKLWDNFLFKGGDFEDGATSQVMEINLVDKKTNSLKQLNEYFALLGKIVKEKERRQKEDMMALEDAMQEMKTEPAAPAGK